MWQAFAFLSWTGGVVYLTICLVGSLYSFWLLGHMHERDGTRYITYRSLGVRALGETIASCLPIEHSQEHHAGLDFGK